MDLEHLVSAACQRHGAGLVHAVLGAISSAASVRLDVTPSGSFVKLFNTYGTPGKKIQTMPISPRPSMPSTRCASASSVPLSESVSSATYSKLKLLSLRTAVSTPAPSPTCQPVIADECVPGSLAELPLVPELPAFRTLDADRVDEERGDVQDEFHDVHSEPDLIGEPPATCNEGGHDAQRGRDNWSTFVRSKLARRKSEIQMSAKMYWMNKSLQTYHEGLKDITQRVTMITDRRGIPVD